MSASNTNSPLSPDLLKQAAWYAAAFGATASLATTADAQIVYADPDDLIVTATYDDSGEGDPVLDGPTIDFDGDGDPEILFAHRSAEQGGSTGNIRSVAVTESGDGEEPTGDYMSNIVGQGFDFGGTVYPYFAPLSAGYTIPDSVGLDVFFIEDFFAGPPVGTFTFGLANPLEIPTGEDTYIALEFTLDDTNVHYAWVRIELLADGEGFIVKDYAFNATPEGSIDTGEGMGLAAEDDLAERGHVVRTAGANPFGAAGTELQVQVAQAEEVRAEVYNVLGQRVETLHAGALVGQKTFSFGHEYAAGLYVVRVTGETFQQTLKVTRN